jgi:hypothetical protein
VSISRDDAYSELSALTSKDGPLNAAEERRRSWLVRKLHEMDDQSGITEARDLQREWDQRDPARVDASFTYN